MGSSLRVFLVVVLAATWVSAQSSGQRAWQQRLHVEIPLAVPVLEVESANPFYVDVDMPPRLVNSNPPRKFNVVGKAYVAAYVDARGECLGAVPLELPFPGMTSALLAEFTGSKFEPAVVGKQEVPSWVVVELDVETRVKNSVILGQDFSMPNHSIPPTPIEHPLPRPSGQLMNLPFSPTSSLNESAIPKRLRMSLGGRTSNVTLRALVHVGANGRCDRYISLEIDPGLDRWFANLLASWTLHPAEKNGQPVDSWLVYTGRVEFKFGGLKTTTFGVARGHVYDPEDAL